MSYNLHRNLSMREAIRIAQELGCTIEYDDEIIFDHPSWGKRMCMHTGRRDAGLALLSKLRKLAKERGFEVHT